MALIDFHTHILPGIDDGSAGAEQSLAMLRMEAEQGIQAVVASPHFYPRYDSPERFLQRREKAYGQLCEKNYGVKGLPQIILGAEVYFFRGMSQSGWLPQLTFGENQCILIEMPASVWPEEMYRELAAIRLQRGIVPIVAHIERYLNVFNTSTILHRLEDAGVMVQANSEFFLSRRTAGTALRLLQAGWVHLLGSDCHDAVVRCPNLGTAEQKIRQKLGDDGIRWIEMNQKALLNL